MSQMYRIFYGPHLILVQSASEEIDNSLEMVDREVIIKLLQFLKKAKRPTEVRLSSSIPFHVFKNFFKKVEAAGGAVYNDEKELLLIYRLGKWDLPKGKLEKKEKPRAAAIREVEEECGASGLTIVEKLKSTYHIHFRKRWILKKTYWYVMDCQHGENLVPQADEGIEKVEWFATETINLKTMNTYRSIREVLLQLELPLG